MKKFLIAAFALSTTPAFASEGSWSHTVSVTTSYSSTTEKSNAIRPFDCNPAIGNWINAAITTCPEQGSGPNSETYNFTITREVRVPCEHEVKQTEGNVY